MIEIILSCLSWALILVGCFFMFTGCLGVIRLPDIFSRIHAAGIIDVFAAPILLLGIGLQYGFGGYLVKIILLIVFLMITGPTGTHIIAKAAILKGVTPLGRHDKTQPKQKK